MKDKVEFVYNLCQGIHDNAECQLQTILAAPSCRTSLTVLLVQKMGQIVNEPIYMHGLILIKSTVLYRITAALFLAWQGEQSIENELLYFKS